jgi:hypothetical protein
MLPAPNAKNVKEYLDRVETPWARTWALDHGGENDRQTILFHICNNGCDAGALNALLTHPKYIALPDVVEDINQIVPGHGPKNMYINQTCNGDGESALGILAGTSLLHYIRGSIKSLADAGANVNNSSFKGVRPVASAAQAKNTDAMIELIRLNAQIDVIDSSNHTPLYHLLSKGEVDSISPLSVDRMLDVIMQLDKPTLLREYNSLLDQLHISADGSEIEHADLSSISELNDAGKFFVLSGVNHNKVLESAIKYRYNELFKMQHTSLRDEDSKYWEKEANKRYASMVLDQAKYQPLLDKGHSKLADVQLEASSHVSVSRAEEAVALSKKTTNLHDATTQTSEEEPIARSQSLSPQSAAQPSSWKKAIGTVGQVFAHFSSAHPPSSDGSHRARLGSERSGTSESARGRSVTSAKK